MNIKESLSIRTEIVRTDSSVRCSISAIVGFLALGFLLAGCASGPIGAGYSRPAISLGMTAVEVGALWGEPDRVKPYEKGAMSGEVWVYESIESFDVGQEVVGFNYITYVDPISGTESEIPDPIFEIKQERRQIITELVMVDDQLVDWTRTTDIHEHF